MSSTGPTLKQSVNDLSGTAMPWLLCGAACGFGLTVLSLGLAVAGGFALFAVGMVRRRADAYGMFTIGFGCGFAAYMALAISIFLLGDSPSFGEIGS